MKVYTTPTVTSVKDASGRYVAAPAQGGTLDSYSIKIKGNGFNATKENNTVKIGGVEATVTAVDAKGTELTVTVPPAATVDGPSAATVVVTVGGVSSPVTGASVFVYLAQ